MRQLYGVAGRSALTIFAVFVLGSALVACSGGQSAPKSTPDMASAMVSSARALAAVTSYDYRDLDASHANAERYLAEPFRSKHDSSWASVRAHAPRLRAVLKGATTDVAVARSTGVWLLSGLDSIGPGTPPTRPSTSWASPDLAAALLSGPDCVARLQTIDRQHFDAQFQAMLDCTTGDLPA